LPRARRARLLSFLFFSFVFYCAALLCGGLVVVFCVVLA
jgi:hypothetical protein